jgi:DNA-binding transcriptional regulator YiaG
MPDPVKGVAGLRSRLKSGISSSGRDCTNMAKAISQGRRAAQTPGVGRHGTSAGSKILAAVEEATEVLSSEGLGRKRLTFRTYKVISTPRPYRPVDVKRARELLGVSQAILAQFLGVNVNTVQSWEQGKRLPQPIACRFLAEIEARPGYWRRRLRGRTDDAE